jgi:membrane protein YqaA with SNARE-associated domain
MPDYLIAFLFVAALESLPAFVPPSWAALLYLQMRLGLNVWAAALVGVVGSTVGRLILTTYVLRASELIISRHDERSIGYLGKKLGKNYWTDFLFVFLYCLTPLSTSPLFLGAALAGIRRRIVFPPFFFGKLISYSLILCAGRRMAPEIVALAHGKASGQGIVVGVLGLGLAGGMLFIDWHALLRERRLKFNFDIMDTKRQNRARSV